MIKYYYSLLVIVAFLATAESLCSHPCSRVNRGTFTNGVNNFVFGCQNTSIVSVYKDDQFIEDRECYARSGPFLVFRVGNQYQCFKDTVYDRRTNIVFIYFAQKKTYETNPLLCDVCSGLLTVAMFVAEGQDLEEAKKIKPPSLGCNRPPNCPVLDPENDVPCTGCEPKEDDGLCCSSCGKSKYEPDRKWYTGSRKRNRGSRKGTPVRRRVNIGSRRGSSGSRRGNTGSRRGNTGSRRGNTGSRRESRGNTGSRRKSAGSRRESAGSRRGNTGSRRESAGSRRGSTGSRGDRGRR